MKNPKLEFTAKVRKHFLLILFVVLVVVGVIFQGLYDWHHLRQQSDAANSDGQSIMIGLLDSAINGLESPAPVDAQTGDVYFPESRLMLPAPSADNLDLRSIEYYSSSDSSGFELQVTTKNILGEAEEKLLLAQANAQNKHIFHPNDTAEINAIFSQVPNLQACSRGVQLFYSPQATNSSDLKLQFTKTLNSGKTIYAYNESACKAEGMPDLVNYLKKIQSY